MASCQLFSAFCVKGSGKATFSECSQVSSCVQSVMTEVGVQHCCLFTRGPAAIHKDPEIARLEGMAD